ncbi:TetR/AcrR family transcriptional regulator [Rhodococcus sp. NPDC057014]|uniref:TetR/AcrR family transcriptional regulator n=1 Tax=unclassified Rhodococcus (in: high G+C Gram-positive bacteria) TaxID=192944 RepID=UPI0023E23202|nr:TetR/AcrR family transcriptional regulator [Rhodococcus sp. T2V]MDF3313276.1 helix-turn-helix domain containing protein [Rhodococcus sp. T2V]
MADVQDATTRKDRRRGRRRDEILAVAAAKFTSQGYEATTLEQIADELELAKASLYYYVSNKEELLLRIAIRHTQEIAGAGMSAAGETGEAHERLWRLIAAHVEAACLQPHTELLDVNSRILRRRAEDGPGVELREIIGAYDRFVLSLVEEGVARGTFAAEPQTASPMIMAAANAMARWSVSQRVVSAADRGVSAAQLIVGGLMSPMLRPPPS